MDDLFDPFGMASGSGVDATVGSSRQDSGPDLFGDLLGSDSSAHSNPAPNTSHFNLSKYISCCDATLRPKSHLGFDGQTILVLHSTFFIEN